MRILKKLLIGVVIVWGLLALMVRAATPFIADYREQIAAAVAEQLGVPVSIGSLKSRWYGLSPLLEFHQVRFGTTTPELIEIERLSVDLEPTELLSGSLVDALRLTIDGMQLTVIREPTGQLHLQGIGTLNPQHAQRHGPVPLPSHIRSLNTRVIWIDRKAGKAPLPIDDVAVVLDRNGSQLNLRASLRSGSGTADLSGRLDGLLTGTAWSGDTYLRVSGLDAAKLFAHYLPHNYGLRSLKLNLETWTHWREATPRHTQGSFQLRDLDLQPNVEGSAALQVADTSARFTFARGPEGLSIGLRDLQLVFEDHHWPLGNLAFSLTEQTDGAARIRAAADYLRIEDVRRVLQVRLPWGELREPLEQLQPAGEIHDLRLTMDRAGGRFNWRGMARFAGLSLAPWGKLPGVDGLSGSVHGQSDHVQVALDSRDAVLRFDQLFRDPLELRELNGRIDLVAHDGGWQLRSEPLSAVTPHISTRSRMRLDWRPGKAPFIDLQTDFSDGDAAFALRYYPSGIMSKALVDWLDSAIQSGRVPGGSLLIHGVLDGFPFEPNYDGIFQVVFDTRDVRLAYRAGWPALEQVDAHVRFHGNQLDIDLAGARIHDSRVIEARARIESLHPTSPITVQGVVRGPLADNLSTLQSDALRDRFGHIAAALHGEGETELHLDFALPLGGHGQTRLDGQLRLDNASLALPEWQLAMSQVSGALDFTLRGVTAHGITARALDAPVVIDILALADSATRVRTRGRFTLDTIRRQLPTVPLPFTSGAADFTVDVDVPAADAAPGSPTGLTVASGLEGVTIDLPAPFGKQPAQRRELSLYLPISGRATPGSLAYAGQVSARFSNDAERVDVVLGGDEAKLRAERGVRIEGKLKTLDTSAWAKVLSAWPADNTELSQPIAIDLRIDRLLADTLTVRQLHVSASREQRTWRGRVEAKDFAGSFVAPEDLVSGSMQVDLQRLALQLPLGSDETPIPALPDTASGPDPTHLPGLTLNIDALIINGAQLGKLRLDAQRAPEGLRVTELSLRGGQLELDSAGYWARTGDAFRTQLGGYVSTKNLGDLLVDLGYSRQLEEAGGRAEFLMQWPGNPAQFHRATMHGKVSLDIGRGRVVELDPGVTRVVGLLNLNALTRRLRLDFSDFYKKGYSFDSITGAFNFERGSARTDDLSVLGPTGRIDVSGSADVMARTLDQKVTVTPNLDATLPIAGTLAGGPVAGLAVLVAQKLMTKQVDNLNRFEYSLDGPWSEPNVKQLSSGGTLSKILRPFSRDSNAQPSAEDPQKEPDTTGSAPASNPGGDAPPDVDLSGAKEPAAQTQQPEQEATEQPGALRSVIDFLKRSEPHGADLPGAAN